MSIKICAIVITYYPKVDHTIINIKKFIDYINVLIIWENTPIFDREKYVLKIPKYAEKIIYLSTNKNEGIAYPINKAVTWAKNNNFNFILTMDQDSYWENFDNFIKNIFSSKFKINNQCVLTPNINHKINDKINFVEKESFITSGTLYPVSVINKVGNFNEKLFVEGVDLDYSLRIIQMGIKIIVITSANLNQNFGYPSKSNYFNLITSNYNSERTYNIVKNHLLIYRKYKNLLTFQQKRMIIRSYILGRLVKVILFENSKISKTIAIIKGVFVGLTKPLAKYFV